jgi:uncharacterized repeat protein (TIGR03803 family)
MTKVKRNHGFGIMSLWIVLGVLCAPLASAQVYTQLHNFDWHFEGANPYEPALLAQGEDGNIYGTLQTSYPNDGSVFLSTPAGVVTPLYIFLGPEGNAPQSGLSLGFDGNFYGTTEWGGGASNTGTAFKFGSSGLTPLYGFGNGTDGGYPWATPIQAPDGNIYGVTNNGNSPGRVYRITPSGTFSVIATAPSETIAPLILGTDGNLYGTTEYGGTYNRGTVFQLTLKGKLKVIHNFNPSTEGAVPVGPVMQGADGKLYGTTSGGGTSGQGIIYQMTTGGSTKVIHNFLSIEGSNSMAGLVQGSDKFLYGVASAGGGNSQGSLFKISTSGTGFQVLHNFQTVDGDTPGSTPTLHTNGIIYGMTHHGGSPNPVYGVLYSFDAGLKPFASLVVIWSGKVGTSVGILGQGFSSATGVKFGSGAGTFTVVSDTYMIASPAQGSTTGNVTVLEPSGNLVTPQVFKVIPSIKDFSPPNGPVGTAVTINGMSLTQTTAVTFGGVKATNFTVNSDTQITAVVPTGAKTGTIGITTKGGKATSNQKFTVQ